MHVHVLREILADSVLLHRVIGLRMNERKDLKQMQTHEDLNRMKLLEILQHATSCVEEINALDQLRKILRPEDDLSGEDDFEHQWLSIAADSLGDEGPFNPFPAHTPDSWFSSQSNLDRFTCYLFERRYSWPEGSKGHLVPLLYTVSTESDAVLKSRLNNLLDEFLRWYLCQDVCQPLLKSLTVAVTHACDMPVVRNQTMIHIMEWLQLHASHHSFHEHLTDVQTLILRGVCDVWSLVRNTSVTRLGRIASNLTLLELESLFSELAKICLNHDSMWQCVEGAVMAISLLLKRCQWIGVLPTSTMEEYMPSPGSKSQYYLKLGKQELSQLPDFISTCIHEIVYPLLVHPQLGVRDHATKAFSTYLSHCDFKVAVESLGETVSKLEQDENFGAWKLSSDGYYFLSHHAILQPSYKFMDACQAEGLLSVCLHLIKHVQSEVLLPNWPRYFWTFSLYLMHPASTVRQAASIIFKYIVAKASSNSGLLKLVLQALCANWSVNIRKDLMESRYSYQGRKMQQEMVKGNLLQRESFGRQFSLEEETQRSTSALHEIQEDDILDKHFCQAWEWREGRLLAYELIVKFLIINHIHYLFPSYALMPPRFDGSVSADSAATHSQKPALPQRPVLSKSFSHNSSSLCQGYTAQFQSLKRSESGQRKKLLEDKRSSTLIEGTFIKKQFSKHYSYFSDQSGLSHDQKGSVNAATSLLCKTRDMDAALKVNEEHIREQEMLIPFPVELQSSEQRSTLPQDVMMLLHAAQSISRVLARQDESDIDWLQNVQLQALSTILRQMLLQTIKCLADGRWEVRRMAQQTLPLITECARWYDMAILTSLWNDYLHPEESLMSYGLALALASSVQHATRLIHLTEAPPMSWKDPDTYHGITLPIIAAVTGGLQKWCGVALSLLGRTAVDKLTVVTLEIIMTTQICFSDTLSESFQCEVAVLTKILHVFCHAHPQHPLSQQCSSEGNLREFESPIDGYLCCLHVAECMESLASQVERYLLTELHQFIPPFLQICSVQGVCTLFQVLLHLVGHFSQDSHVATSLLDGCVIVGNKIAKWMQQFTSHDEKPLMHVVNAAVEEITALVTDQNTEMSTLKLLFDVFLSISDFVEAEKLTLMLSALSSRLKGMGTVNLDNNTYKSSEDMDTKILIYLSNNIAAIQADNGDSSDEDAEENHGENQAAESLSLSVSGGSGQMPWPAHVGTEEHEIYAERNNQDGSGSDWDWDDEQEDQASLYSVVSQFFQQLQESHKGDGPSLLVTAIRQLQEKDQTVLKKLFSY